MQADVVDVKRIDHCCFLLVGVRACVHRAAIYLSGVFLLVGIAMALCLYVPIVAFSFGRAKVSLRFVSQKRRRRFIFSLVKG